MPWQRQDDPVTIDYLAHINSDVATMARVLRTSGGTEAVPACSGWTVADLVTHLGGVHRWVQHLVASGQPTREHEAAPVADVDALAGWLIDGADALCATLASTDPAAPCWTFGMPAGTAGFWRRRQALETVVHRTDMEQAAGLSIHLTLSAADVEQGWTIGESDAEKVLVEGTVAALFLWLWHRTTSATDLLVQGPADAIANLNASSLVP